MIEVNGKQISSNKITIKDAFGSDMWYSIPDYQRPYVWGEEQISLLLDDISYAAQFAPDTQYFLGSLVLHCTKKEKDGAVYIENSILDGQQRLTTLYLLQAVIRDISNTSQLKGMCSEAIYQEGNIYDGIPERLRIEFEIRDDVEEFINNFIKTENGTSQIDKLKIISEESPNTSIKNMASAILILRKWFNNEENLDIDTFFPFFRQYVILIYVASGELEDSFRLFTVLNDRGIKLRNSDILKAQNLREVNNNAQQKKYAIFWEELEGELEEDFDLFLSYIRTVLVKEKARYNLLKEFEDNIYHPKEYNKSLKKYENKTPLLSRGVETFQFIQQYKGYYDLLLSENNYDLNNNWAFDNLISILEDSAPSDIWFPALLKFIDTFGTQSLLEFLIKLDNKFSADWISRETPTSRIEAMRDILIEIEKVDSIKDLEKHKKIQQLLESSVFKFNYNEFILQLSESNIYGRRYTRYLLRKIDFLLDAPLYQERRTSYNNMSVEHILPQNPEENSQWVNDFTELEREEWTHKLGNLALISRRKNSKQGRLDFSVKKEKYFKNSIETFPNSLVIMQKEEWTIEELKDNHFNLIEKLKNHYSK